mgnify:CR=1 FL=1
MLTVCIGLRPAQLKFRSVSRMKFMRDGGGAGLISISHFTTIFTNLEGISVPKSKLRCGDFISHSKIDEKCETDVILG